jgi:hypothetical protein
MNTRVFKPTAEDWYPSYKLAGWYNGQEGVKLVEVSLLPLSSYPVNVWRVCVWGSDDCGMEKDLTNYEDAEKLFLGVIRLQSVTRKDLLALGFEYC